MTDTPREDAEPATAEQEPAVDGVAVELPGESAPVPPVAPAPPAPPVAAAPPKPPVAPVAPAAAVPVIPPAPVKAPAPVTPPPPAHVSPSTAEAVGSAFDGHAPEPPMNPLGDIAAERPEILVGAAFAGGILAAMILRRLGS